MNLTVKYNGYYESSGYYDRYANRFYYTYLCFYDSGTFESFQPSTIDHLVRISNGQFEIEMDKIILKYKNDKTVWNGLIVDNEIIFKDDWDDDQDFVFDGAKYKFISSDEKKFEVIGDANSLNEK